MSDTMFRFWVRNETTKQSTQFLGQGESLESAWKDGTKNVIAAFRPRDGKGNPHGLCVTMPDGSKVTRTLQEFERDETKP